MDCGLSKDFQLGLSGSMASYVAVVVMIKLLTFHLALLSANCATSKDFSEIKLLFSDKNPYHFIDKPVPHPAKCLPVHINMVIRHGSRYPAKSRVKTVTGLLEKINSFFVTDTSSNTTFHYNNLSLPWSFPSDILNSASKELSTLGSQEMYDIARRFRLKFPNIFSHGYSNLNYSFIATDKLRSSQSAVAFGQGIFERRGNVGVSKYQPVAVKTSAPSGRDRILRFHESCCKWQKKNPRRRLPSSEYKKFLNGPEMRSVIGNITKRLNLTGKINLRANTIVEMFLLCAYGIQTDSADTSWCSLFEEKDLKVLEYLNDLKLYWAHSYGRKINYKMACPLYIEITDSFESFLKNRKPHGLFRFAHTGTVTPLLTMLGLFKDSVPPRANNFDQQSNRKFRFSNVVPMSANVAFVLYKCKGKNQNDKAVKHKNSSKSKTAASNSAETKILMMVNEVALPLPSCGGETSCNLQRFLSYYSHIKKDCNIKAICGRRKDCKKRRGD